MPPVLQSFGFALVLVFLSRFAGRLRRHGPLSRSTTAFMLVYDQSNLLFRFTLYEPEGGSRHGNTEAGPLDLCLVCVTPRRTKRLKTIKITAAAVTLIVSIWLIVAGTDFHSKADQQAVKDAESTMRVANNEREADLKGALRQTHLEFVRTALGSEAAIDLDLCYEAGYPVNSPAPRLSDSQIAHCDRIEAHAQPNSAYLQEQRARVERLACKVSAAECKRFKEHEALQDAANSHH
mgnify:CR=1 FL=1